MLSPHELATLMVLKTAPARLDSHRVELETLREQELIVIESMANGASVARLTARGDALLRFVDRKS